MSNSGWNLEHAIEQKSSQDAAFVNQMMSTLGVGEKNTVMLPKMS